MIVYVGIAVILLEVYLFHRLIDIVFKVASFAYGEKKYLVAGLILFLFAVLSELIILILLLSDFLANGIYNVFVIKYAAIIVLCLALNISSMVMLSVHSRIYIKSLLSISIVGLLVSILMTFISKSRSKRLLKWSIAMVSFMLAMIFAIFLQSTEIFLLALIIRNAIMLEGTR